MSGLFPIGSTGFESSDPTGLGVSSFSDFQKQLESAGSIASGFGLGQTIGGMGQAVSGTASEIGSAVSGTVSFFSFITSRAGVERIGLVVLGLVFVVASLFMFGKHEAVVNVIQKVKQ